MGMLDRVKKLAKGRERQISQAVDKAGDAVNKRTGGKYADQIDKVGDKVDDTLGGPGGQAGPGPRTAPPPPAAGHPDADPPPRPVG